MKPCELLPNQSNGGRPRLHIYILATRIHGGTSLHTYTMPVYGHLEQFQGGQDWETYIAVLINYFGTNEITSTDKQKQILLSAVGLDTYDLICTLVAPDTPESKTFDELVKMVQEHVRPSPSKIVVRFKFYILTRTEGESISSFVVKLR